MRREYRRVDRECLDQCASPIGGRARGYRFACVRGDRGARRFFFITGDNDLNVTVSPYRAVLVATATEGVRHATVADSRVAGVSRTLYVAKGVKGLNGHCAAGIIESLCRFFAQARRWSRCDSALAGNDVRAVPPGNPDRSR